MEADTSLMEKEDDGEEEEEEEEKLEGGEGWKDEE